MSNDLTMSSGSKLPSLLNALPVDTGFDMVDEDRETSGMTIVRIDHSSVMFDNAGDETEELVGHMLAKFYRRKYYEKGWKPGSADAPDCASIGLSLAACRPTKWVEAPMSDACADCELSQFVNHEDGTSDPPKCKAYLYVVMWLESTRRVHLVEFPPTSLDAIYSKATRKREAGVINRAGDKSGGQWPLAVVKLTLSKEKDAQQAVVHGDVIGVQRDPNELGMLQRLYNEANRMAKETVESSFA